MKLVLFLASKTASLSNETSLFIFTMMYGQLSGRCNPHIHRYMYRITQIFWKKPEKSYQYTCCSYPDGSSSSEKYMRSCRVCPSVAKDNAVGTTISATEPH